MKPLMFKSSVLISMIIIFICINIWNVADTHRKRLVTNCSRYTSLGNLKPDPFYCSRMQNSYLRFCDRNKYDLRIIVIVFDRPLSLLRILQSLNDAIYDGDKVKLEVWIDRSVHGYLDAATVETANTFSFKHGLYEVIPRLEHAGLLGQWLSTWRPMKNTSEIAVICEDDITVSKYFYKYLKIVHNKYDNYPYVNGYTLQGFTMKHHIKDKSMLSVPKEILVFLYPSLGTYGFSPCKENWIHFQEWYMSVCSNMSVDLSVPNRKSNRWLKAFKQPGKQDHQWEPLHIYYAYINSEFTLYINLPGHVGFATHWREKGLHFKSHLGKSNDVMQYWMEEFEKLPTQPKRLDILGKIME